MPRLTRSVCLHSFLLFLCCSLIAISCSGRQRRHVIPQGKFVDVLVDIHLADAIALEYRPEYSGFVLDSAELYGSVFRKHEVTKEQFDSTVSYYGSHPAEFQKIYNKVISRINLISNELLEPDTTAGVTAEEVVWLDDKAHAIPEMGSASNVEISVPLSSPGTYTFSATVKLYTDDESVDPRISIYYWYDDQTPGGYRDAFPEVKLEKDGQQHVYTLTRNVQDSRVTHLKGNILQHSDNGRVFRKHALVSEIRLTRSP